MKKENKNQRKEGKENHSTRGYHRKNINEMEI